MSKIYLLLGLYFFSFQAFATNNDICNEPSTVVVTFSDITTIDRMRSSTKSQYEKICHDQYNGSWTINIPSDKKKKRVGTNNRGQKIVFYREKHAYFKDEHAQADIYVASDQVIISGKMHTIYFLSALVDRKNNLYFEGSFITSDGCRGNYSMHYLTLNNKPAHFSIPHGKK